MISRREALRLIVLHPKQNIESEIKWQSCSATVKSKFSCSSVQVKGLYEKKTRYRKLPLHNKIIIAVFTFEILDMHNYKLNIPTIFRFLQYAYKIYIHM